MTKIKNGLSYTIEFKNSVMYGYQYRKSSQVDYAKERNISISTLRNWLIEEKRNNLNKQRECQTVLEGILAEPTELEVLRNKVKILEKLVPENILFIDGKYYKEVA